ncbi:hypothetical protein [Vibrio furnissii]|uniref:hypothetical protein n=1 Tax=Vibrio furnissii TaxID=29494 RepID=UPI001EEB0DCB|nr:hypothetical protein [Vibrio furnissii]MCG6260243.1 hypothetical protein [Vibrio furnissii]
MTHHETAALCAAFLLLSTAAMAQGHEMTHVALLEGQLQVDCTLDSEHTLHLTVESQASFSGSVSVVSASGSRILHRLQGQTTLTLGLGAEQLPLTLTAGTMAGESESLTIGAECKTAP